MKRNISARILPAILICLLGHAALVLAQQTAPVAATVPPGNVLAANNRFMYRVLKGVLIRSAEKMPEENYGFKPTEAVRSFGQIVGHVADAHRAGRFGYGGDHRIPRTAATMSSAPRSRCKSCRSSTPRFVCGNRPRSSARSHAHTT